jgi:hypothetical protein
VLLEEALEHGVDRLRRPEHTLEPSAAATRPNDRQVARPRLAEALSVEDDRDARGEERLPDHQLPALGDLDDEEVGPVCRV